MPASKVNGRVAARPAARARFPPRNFLSNALCRTLRRDACAGRRSPIFSHFSRSKFLGETRRLDKARRAEVAHFPRDVERNAEALTIIVPIKAKGDAYFTG